MVRLGQGDFNFLPTLIKANIAGVVLKNCPPGELLRAVQEVLEGSNYFSTRIRTLLEQNFIFRTPNSCADRIEQLTRQEIKVLKMVAEGLANKDIASDLGLSVRTIEKHREALRNKLQCSSTEALVNFAVRHRIARRE